jgi:hypothetical protein
MECNVARIRFEKICNLSIRHCQIRKLVLPEESDARGVGIGVVEQIGSYHLVNP